MQWLTALLAFATTMFVFAVIVSMLVEMIHRIWDLRSKGMKLMLKNLYSRVIEPKLIGPSGACPPTADEFASMMMENRAVMAKGETSRGFFNWFKRCFVDRAVVTDIPVAVFMQKLVHDRVLGTKGTAANEVLNDENVLKDIAQKYEAFGQEVSICFESRARLLSVFVAFVKPFPCGDVLRSEAESVQKLYHPHPALRATLTRKGGEGKKFSPPKKVKTQTRLCRGGRL